MKLTQKQIISYLDNPKYKICDKYLYLQSIKEDDLNDLYFRVAEDKIYKKTIDKKGICWYKYKLAHEILKSKLDELEYNKK